MTESSQCQQRFSLTFYNKISCLVHTAEWKVCTKLVNDSSVQSPRRCRSFNYYNYYGSFSNHRLCKFALCHKRYVLLPYSRPIGLFILKESGTDSLMSALQPDKHFSGNVKRKKPNQTKTNTL